MKLGPKFRLTPYPVAEVITHRAEHETLHARARFYGVTHTTIMRRWTGRRHDRDVEESPAGFDKDDGLP